MSKPQVVEIEYDPFSNWDRLERWEKYVLLSQQVKEKRQTLDMLSRPIAGIQSPWDKESINAIADQYFIQLLEREASL